MIAMKATPGQEFSTTLSRRYVADDKGMIRDVHIADVSELLAAGASTATLPATVTLKAQPGQSLYFDGKTHAVGADGLIRDVPFDVAVIQIKAGVCVEATESDEVGETPAGETAATLGEAPSDTPTDSAVEEAGEGLAEADVPEPADHEGDDATLEEAAQA